MKILRSFLFIFLLLGSQNSYSFDISGLIQRGRTVLQNAGTTTLNFVQDSFNFDPAPVLSHKEPILIAIRQVRQQNIEIINHPNSHPEQKDIANLSESRRSGDCATVNRLRSQLLEEIETRCQPDLVRETCREASSRINALVGQMGLSEDEVTRRTHNAQRAGILNELKGFRDRVYTTLKNEIYPLNQSCSSVFNEQFNSEACLRIYDDIIPPYQQEVAQNCTEDAVNNMFDSFISHMQSSGSPFRGVYPTQSQRQQARQTEFEIASLLIQVDDAVRAWEDAGRAPSAILISPRPEARPAGLDTE